MSPLFLFTIFIPEIIVHDVSFVITHARIYMCAFLFMVDLTLNRAIYRPFCYFSPIRCWFYAYLCSVKPTETRRN